MVDKIIKSYQVIETNNTYLLISNDKKYNNGYNPLLDLKQYYHLFGKDMIVLVLYPIYNDGYITP